MKQAVLALVLLAATSIGLASQCPRQCTQNITEEIGDGKTMNFQLGVEYVDDEGIYFCGYEETGVDPKHVHEGFCSYNKHGHLMENDDDLHSCPPWIKKEKGCK